MSIIRAPSAQCHPMKWTICILCGMRWFPGCQTLTLTTKLSMFTHRMASISSTMQVMIVHHKQTSYQEYTDVLHLHHLFFAI